VYGHRNINKRKAQHQALVLLGALLLAAACSLAHADPLADPAESTFEPAHMHGLRPVVSVLAPAAHLAPRLPIQSRLAGAVHELVSSRDLAISAGTTRTPEPEEQQERVANGFSTPWRPNVNTINPRIVTMIRNYKRDGAPIVHLWDSDKSVLAIGLNPHGVPGIYFTRHITG